MAAQSLLIPVDPTLVNRVARYLWEPRQRESIALELASRALVPVVVPGWRVPIEVRLYRQNAAMAPTAEALWQLIGGPVDATAGPPR